MRTRISKSRRALRLSPIEQLESRLLLSSALFVATNGSDQNPGTLAAPFRTIQHAAAEARAGDTVFVRGGTYRETVDVNNSGTSAAPITFEPYDNESVTIDGANPISGWKGSGPVYTASMPENLGQGNNQVFVDHKMINQARWPNTSLNLSHPTYATVGSTSGVSNTSATIKDSHLTQPSGFWVGATMHLAAGQGWVFQTGTVTKSGPGFVTFSYVRDSVQYQTPTAGNHYYLSGVAGALDAPGEWFRASNGTLSIRTPSSDNPANHLIEAKARLYGFDINGSYIDVSGFHFFACTIITGSGASHVVINRITAQYVSHSSTDANGFYPPIQDGIRLAGNYDVLENSVIADTAGNGVFVSGSYVAVFNNLLHDVDYSGVDGAAIRVGGYADSISYNTCYNCGRSGMVYAGNRDLITHNNVYDYGLQTTDLGGFYTSGYGGNGTVVAYNDFHDGFTGGFGGVGIMFDQSTSDFIVYRNIVWHVNTALGMNGTQLNMKIYNNTLDASRYSIAKDGFMQNWSGTRIENNIVTHPIYVGSHLVLSHNLSNNGKFVNAAHGNFTLLSSAPAINAGLVIPPYTNGYVGKAPDDGALEFGKPAFADGVNYSRLPADPST